MVLRRGLKLQQASGTSIPGVTTQKKLPTPSSPDAAHTTHVPTAREVAELSMITLEAGHSVLQLSEHARSSHVRGEVFSCEEIVQMRLRAIEWLTTQFVKFGYRDEWLTTAVNYMDRAACAWTTSGAMGNANSRSVEVCDAAKQVMACEELWLAAVGVALRMSEAENELDALICALVFPLVSFGQPGYKCDRQKW